MSYASKHLIPDEKLLYETRLSWVVLFWPVIVPSLILLGLGGYLVYHYANADVDNMKEIGVGLIVAAALVFGIGLTKRNATEMAVTNKRVLIKQGVFGRRTLEILLQKIESIAVEESMSGRILGFGTVIVRGTGGTPEPFKKMAHPLEFRRHVEEQVESLMK
jgi:uncharacterized membrane protein YdbT with pleckstrin-like domain|nr:PH domain-containing protein [Candidatus Acidoferrales bacterium]